MSHPEQQAFFAAISRVNRSVVEGGRILEIGSYDVNGTIRNSFAAASEYVGVDLDKGPGVDRVGYGHEVADPDGSMDVTISGECFEHDPHWRDTFANMVRLTRPGGLVAFTCASRGRPEHGTTRTLVVDSPGTQAVGLDYYKNLEEDDFAGFPLDDWFEEWNFWYMPTSFDLYFAGVRRGEGGSVAVMPADSEIEAIRELMPLPHRVVRWPLKVASRMVGDGEPYQRTILPYWLFMLRRFGERASR